MPGPKKQKNKSKSKSQQRFMGMIHAIHKGELKPSEVSPKMRETAKRMKKKDAKEFAETKHTGLPEKVKKKAKKKVKEMYQIFKDVALEKLGRR